MFVLLLLLTLLRPVITEAQEQRKNIAILDAILLDSSPSWNRAVQRGMTDTIIGYFVREGSYTVLDRGSYQQIATELEFQSRGFVDDAQVQQFGRQSGAEYIVVIRVGEPARDRFIVTGSIMHVETGAVVDQVSEMRSGTVNVLFDLAHVVGARLADRDFTETASPVIPLNLKNHTTAERLPLFSVGFMAGFGEELDWDTEEEFKTTTFALRFNLRHNNWSLRPSLGLVFREDLKTASSVTSVVLPLTYDISIGRFLTTYIGPYLEAYTGFGGGVNIGFDVAIGSLILGFDFLQSLVSSGYVGRRYGFYAAWKIW